MERRIIASFKASNGWSLVEKHQISIAQEHTSQTDTLAFTFG